MRIRAWRAMNETMARGAAAYVRDRHLPMLLPDLAWRHGGSCARIPREEVVEALRAALRHERALGRENSWRYRLGRHIGLMQALAAECRAEQNKRRRPDERASSGKCCQM